MKVETALRSEIPASNTGEFREAGEGSPPAAGAFGGTGVADARPAERTRTGTGTGTASGTASFDGSTIYNN